MNGNSRYWVPGRFVLVVVGWPGLPLMVERLEVDETLVSEILNISSLRLLFLGYGWRIF
jgi:hypothetical protein